MTVLWSAALIGVLSALSFGLWRLSIEYSVDRRKVTLPGGPMFDVLVHREGVVLYTRGAAYINAYSIGPTVVALLKRASSGPWRWAVTVRQSPFAGYRDLVHEVFDDAADARTRAGEIADLIAEGKRLWAQQAEL